MPCLLELDFLSAWTALGRPGTSEFESDGGEEEIDAAPADPFERLTRLEMHILAGYAEVWGCLPLETNDRLMADEAGAPPRRAGDGPERWLIDRVLGRLPPQ